MKKFLRWCVTHPIVILPFLLALIGFFAFQLPKLRVDFSPSFQPGVQQELYAKAQADFGVKLCTVVLQNPGDDIFTKDSLMLLRELTSALEGFNGVERVQSLATVKAVRGGKGFVRVEPLFSVAALDGENLLQIKQQVLNTRFWRNTLIDENGARAMIQVYVADKPEKPIPSQEGSSQGEFAAALLGQIEQILVANKNAGYDLSLAIEAQFQSGPTVSQIVRLLLFIPLAIALMCSVLFLAYRKLAALLLPLLNIGASLVTTLGFMAYMGYSLNPITLLVLPLILALACVEGGRALFSYFYETEEETDKHAQLIRTVQRDGFPLLVTSLTLALGLAAFAFSNSPQLRQFGLSAAFGVALNWLFCLFLLPGFGYYLPFSSNSARPFQFSLLTFQGWIITLYERYRLVTVTILAALLLFALSGIPSLRIEPAEWRSYTSSVPPGLSLNLVLEGGRENRLKEPEVLRQLDALQHFVAQQAWCDSTRSFVDYLKLVHREMLGGAAEMAAIPGSRELVSQYLLLLEKVDLHDVVNADYSAANILVTHRLDSTRELSTALDSIREYAQASLSNDVTLEVTGYEILRQDALEHRVKVQLLSLPLLLGSAFLFLSLLFLSFKVGLVALLPSLFALALHFGLMVWLKIPLYEGTCLAAILALSLSLSNVIHFLVRYRKALMETNDQNQAVGTTIYHEGEAMLFTSASLLLGFSLSAFSAFSDIPMAAHLGALSALSLLYALLNVFLVNPLLLDMIQIITVWDFVRFDLDKQLLRKNQLFTHLRASQMKKLLLLGGIRRFSRNEMIVRQGEQGDSMYILISGQAEIYAERNGHKRVLTGTAPGTLFGEMALLGEPVRSANVRALEETKCLQIDERSLMLIKKAYPRIAAQLYLNISSLLSDRLKGQISHLLNEERTRSELATARRIQQDLLPDARFDHSMFHVVAINQPTREVGGDFYDYFQVNEHEYVMIIGDVCGKGVPAAIFMARAMSILRAQAQIDPEPLPVLSAANTLIAGDSRSQGLYVTLFYGLYNTQTRSLRYVNAGQSAPLLLSPSRSSCSSLAVTNHAAGMFDFSNFEVAELPLEEGDTLILHTDGIDEANNAEGERFGGERLAQLLLEVGQASPEAFRKAIIERVTAFVGKQEQYDDMTLLIVQV